MAKKIGWVLVAALVAAVAWAAFNVRLLPDDRPTQAATDGLERYNMAVAHGTTMDVCVQAGAMKASYLMAKDDANYSKWVERERADCSRAGIKP